MKLTALALASAFFVPHSWANNSVDVTNKVGLKLAQEGSKIFKGRNYIVSPVSPQQSLSLIANGTSHHTRFGIQDLLAASVDMVNYEGSRYVKSINFSPDQKRAYKTQYPHANPAVISIQNSVWNNNGQTDGRRFFFNDEFKHKASVYYNAPTTAIDFKAKTGVGAINAWVNKGTYGLIKEMVTLDNLKPLVWAVFNTSYIEASWEKPFSVMTSGAPQFVLSDEKTKITVPMIMSRQSFEHAKLPDGTEVISIPFGSGPTTAALTFMVYLPPKSKETDAEKKAEEFEKAQRTFFSSSFLLKTLAGLKPAFINVIMPKFSFSTDVTMRKNEELTKLMNMNFLFQDNADYSALSNSFSSTTTIGLIKQSNRIELDEKGVKAAGTTLVGGVPRMGFLSSPKDFVVDRPFMFAIVEKKSNSIFFAGTVVDPR